MREENLGSFYLPNYKKKQRAGRETAWDYVKDDPNLPRVMLIGDSISGGYTLPVRHVLAGRVNVHRAPKNCSPTKRGLEKLEAPVDNLTQFVTNSIRVVRHLRKRNLSAPDCGKCAASGVHWKTS